MVEKYDSIVHNSVWDVVPRPENKSVVSSHWLYKVKQVVDGSVEKHKERFVACGFSQMDVKTAFLNGDIEEEVYIEQPKGFETFDRDSHVCRLKRALYGMKKAPRAWYTKIDNYFTGLGFIKSEANANLYNIVVKVWQKDGEFFVSQGKYDNEILKGFHMETCKPMQTPLVGNWRKEDDTLGEVVEATVYRKLMGSLLYLVNT
eukprot:PITA_28165